MSARRHTTPVGWVWIAIFATIVFAQDVPDVPDAPGLTDDEKKFLNTPIWYLSYRISLVGRGGASGEGGTGWSAKADMCISGTAQLGIRSQGALLTPLIDPKNVDVDALKGIQIDPAGGPPVLTKEQIEALTKASQQAGNFLDRTPYFANWIGGAPLDPKKTDAENEAALWKVMQANAKAFKRLSREEEVRAAMPIAESRQIGIDHSRTFVQGSAPILCLADWALEIDTENKKYKLKLPSGFPDSEQSMKALVGESVSHIGTPNEFHQPIEISLDAGGHATMSACDLKGPIEAKLPKTYQNLAGSPSFAATVKISSFEVGGTFTVQYSLSPKPPDPAELLIFPPTDYDEWRPLGAKDEKTAGDYVPIRVKLQKQGGGDPQFKAMRFIYMLKKSSKDLGVCMNAPPQPITDAPFDLQFEQSQNPNHSIFGDQRQLAIESGNGQMTEGEISISTFDYAAIGELEVLAELENGEVVHGKVKSTGREELLIPARKDNSRIANVFLKNLNNPGDADDSEDKPVGDGFAGDGLSLYEEYRGFKVGDYWTTADPRKKDVFVLNQMRGLAQIQRGIKLFEKVTDFKVHHLLLDDQVNAVMVINFNAAAGPHVVDQHVIRIKASKPLAGRRGAAFVEEVGTPGTAKSVNMPPDWEEFRNVGGRMIPSFERTLAHEMLHDVNVNHHGEADDRVDWILQRSPTPHVVERSSTGERIIVLKREDGSTIDALNLFVPGAPDGSEAEDIPIGVRHGQHSGHENCLMRYWIAWAYPSLNDPAVFYYARREVRGTILCPSSAGTGVNDAGHRPQSRYGPAATPANGGPDVKLDRGDCLHQLRVNDKGQEPQR